MEMEKMIGGGGDGGVPELEEKESPRRRRPLLVAGLAALFLLAFFVLGRESTSTVWEMATAKLLAVVNNDAAAGDVADELLGGLLAAGVDRRTCRSLYELWRYYKHFPYRPSLHLLRSLRAYEARHRRCAPGTPLYAKAVEQLKSGHGGAAAMEEECRYVVWLPFDGLGNRMLSMASGFLYALLTGRVFLVALQPDSGDLFCEPFPNTTWLFPSQDYPVDNLPWLGQSPNVSLTAFLAANKTIDDAAYVYLSLGWQMTDGPFFCGEHQAVLGKVSWLFMFSDLYFVPSLYPIAEFRDELRRLFPAAMESISHLLLRYLLHPTNPVWDMVTAYYASNLAYADKRIGIQIRMFDFASVPADDLYNQILSCSRQENILPETDGDEVAAAGNSTTAIFIASLYADYYERLKTRYQAAAGSSSKVGVFQRTHEEQQATEKLEHNQRALAEIFLLSLSEEMVTSGMSTFGYVSSSIAGIRPAILLPAHDHMVPAPPCRRAVSMEPCNLTPPRGVTCSRGMAVDGEDVARHLKVCEDRQQGVKLFD
ncbi:hypothetical protein HU200_027921 [Digitaria exilis]|uniref:Fucosyltransferase n=1 Tax=Digitaria exilis TaxID=1010633 RepID=A0A835ESW7_9POAL|nr:hypothetical protein HU200_027921 [Digitaria exilis]